MPDETRPLNTYPPSELLALPATSYPDVAARLRAFVLSPQDALAQASQPDWLVNGMIAKGNLIVLAGPAKKAGKSWLGLHLARCVARGSPFLGRGVQQGYVYYVNVEDGIKRIGFRMKCLGFEADDRLALNIVHERKALLPLYEALPLLAARVGVKLIIIDPLIKLEHAHGILDENDSVQVDRLIDYYHTMAEALGICIVLVHHFRKAADQMRGSSAIEAASDGWWNLTPGRDGHRYLEGTVRDGRDFELGIKYDFARRADGALSVVLTPVAPELARPEQNAPKRGNGSKSNGARARDGKRAPRSDAELYNEVLALVRAAQGASLLKTAVIKAVGGRAERVSDIIDTLIADGAVAASEQGLRASETQ